MPRPHMTRLYTTRLPSRERLQLEGRSHKPRPLVRLTGAGRSQLVPLPLPRPLLDMMNHPRRTHSSLPYPEEVTLPGRSLRHIQAIIRLSLQHTQGMARLLSHHTTLPVPNITHPGHLLVQANNIRPTHQPAPLNIHQVLLSMSSVHPQVPLVTLPTPLTVPLNMTTQTDKMRLMNIRLTGAHPMRHRIDKHPGPNMRVDMDIIPHIHGVDHMTLTPRTPTWPAAHTPPRPAIMNTRNPPYPPEITDSRIIVRMMGGSVSCQNPADGGFCPHQRRVLIITGTKVKVDPLTKVKVDPPTRIIMDMLRFPPETLPIHITTERMSRTGIPEMVLIVDTLIQVKVKLIKVKVMGQGHQHIGNILENTQGKVSTVQVVNSSAPQVQRKEDLYPRYRATHLKVKVITGVKVIMKVNELSTVLGKELFSQQTDIEWILILIFK